MQNPKTQKEAQRLTRIIVALTRFISRPRDWSLPFFKAIKTRKEFEWTPDCEQSFQELKSYLQSPQLLARPVVGDVLQLYLAVSEYALSSVLITEEAKVQRPVYYFSHPVEVVTDQPLQKILENTSRSGRIVKWAIEFSEFDLRYKPGTTIKAQALVDFMVECTHYPGEAAPEWVSLIEDSQDKVSFLYVDGVSNLGGLVAGILLWSPRGNKIEYSLRFSFTALNNEAPANGLTLANALGAEHIHVRIDSQLLVGHVKGDFKIDETT
ncbi:hypothetical protein LIER_35105 [Lithospermum erythrorhizon]|uniref:Reverse transcriptase/retrotransposon-derived protein RNase H-like domain-containing protein n=1 Tax=Lithospermum erythrorhizon TaxID=34254 RepID=A0AAV3NKE4_LITER